MIWSRASMVAGALIALAGCGGGGARTGDGGPPAEPATNTIPFTGGVYLPVSLRNVGTALHRVWPTESARDYFGFKLDARRFAFRQDDGALFYLSPFDGLLIDDAADDNDSSVPTPPCDGAPTPTAGHENLDTCLGFDGQGRVHYRCVADLYRGSGELVETASYASGVLADGRYLRVVGEPNDLAGWGFEVHAADSTLLSAMRLGSASDRVLPVPDATTVVGNDAFVLFARSAFDAGGGQRPTELIAYRIDAQSRWLPVARRQMTPLTLNQLVISDGTIFLLAYDPAMSVPEYQLTAMLPDGSERVVWHESYEVVVSQLPLLVGPTEPAGPSVR